jgi:hypothetical protein
VGSCLNWINKSYAYAPCVEFPVGTYETISEQDEGPFEGRVDVVGRPQDTNQVWKGPSPR